MAHRYRILIVCELVLLGKALAETFAQYPDRYEVALSAGPDTDVPPPGFHPDIVILWCVDDCPVEVEAVASSLPNAHCIVVARAPDAEKQILWMREGADGILDEAATTTDFKALEKAIQVVLDGELWAPRKVLARFVFEVREGLESGAETSLH